MDYSKYLNSSIQSIHPSGIRKFFDIANEMEDVISLSIGEPDFQTPWHIRDEGIRSLEKGRTWYSPNRGFADLLKEITKYYKRRFGITYEPQTQTLVTVGGSEAIDLAFRTLVERGDEVIIPQPAFVCYEPLTVMAGGVPVIINTKNEDNFRLRADDLRAAITDKTKMLVLPFPNNPTGAIMERHDLEEIAQVCIEKDILVLSDEIYSELTYGGRDHVSIASIDGMYERTIVINGFSKSYAMTGWRLGYVLGPVEVVTQMTKLHQYGIMSAPTTARVRYAPPSGGRFVQCNGTELLRAARRVLCVPLHQIDGTQLRGLLHPPDYGEARRGCSGQRVRRVRRRLHPRVLFLLSQAPENRAREDPRVS